MHHVLTSHAPINTHKFLNGIGFKHRRKKTLLRKIFSSVGYLNDFKWWI